MHRDSQKQVKDLKQHLTACTMLLAVDKTLLKKSVKYFKIIKLEIFKN